MAETENTAADTDPTLPLDQQTADVLGEDASDGMVRKKDIYDHVTVATGLRKREVREAVDATLAYLHSCLSDGREIQMPPLGKMRVIDKSKGDKPNVQYKLNLQKSKSQDDDADD